MGKPALLRPLPLLIHCSRMMVQKRHAVETKKTKKKFKFTAAQHIFVILSFLWKYKCKLINIQGDMGHISIQPANFFYVLYVPFTEVCMTKTA